MVSNRLFVRHHRIFAVASRPLRSRTIFSARGAKTRENAATRDCAGFEAMRHGSGKSGAHFGAGNPSIARKWLWVPCRFRRPLTLRPEL